MTFKTIKEKVEILFENTKLIALATANNQGVISTAQMCLVNDGLTAYVQTDAEFEKVRNLKENSNIAFNIGAYNFKGKASFLGQAAENAMFVEKIKAKHIETYNSYTNLPNTILIRIDLTEARIWGKIDNKDIHNQKTITIVDFVKRNISEFVCDY